MVERINKREMVEMHVFSLKSNILFLLILADFDLREERLTKKEKSEIKKKKR
jgi:hypothetical protein